MSTTEKVRLRGLIERSRVTVVEVAGKGRQMIEAESGVQTDDDLTTMEEAFGDSEGTSLEENHGRWEMEVARIYEKTIVELGSSFDMAAGGVG